MVPYCAPPSRGGNSGGLGSLLGLDRSLSLTPFPFPDDPPLEPDPAMLYGSSSGIGMPGRLRISMADRGFLTVDQIVNTFGINVYHKLLNYGKHYKIEKYNILSLYLVAFLT